MQEQSGYWQWMGFPVASLVDLFFCFVVQDGFCWLL